ncbi:hypothetical protein HYS00_01110 [Candidatus Microgenomates bacterium]|nr:hypothetical protein [Candidatus Microgenomates bacterium]
MNRRELLIISVGIFMTIIAWVVADVYHAQSQDTIDTTIAVPPIKSISVNKDLIQSIRMRE